MTRIFISYRRDDAGYVASILRKHLEAEYGPGSVFMDIDSIPLGVDFRQHLSDAVSRCDVLLALIGETWAGPLPGGTQRRIDDPKDFVRIEVESALKRGIPVVPVLIDKAAPPAVESLPAGLRDLAFRNAAELRAGRDLESHLGALSRGLQAHVQAQRGRAGATAAAAPASAPPDAAAVAGRAGPPAAPPPAAPAAPLAGSAGSSRAPWPWVLVGGVAAAAAVGSWWAASRPTPAPAPTPATASTAAPFGNTAGSRSPPSTAPAPSPAPAPAPALPAAPVLGARAPTTVAAETPPTDPGPPALGPGKSRTPPDGAVAGTAALDGYRIAIYYPAGDGPAGATARALRGELAVQGLRRDVELRLATAQFLREVVPPDGLELRYEAGVEDAPARALAAALAAGPGRRTLRLVPAGTSTPKFLSIFVPTGG